MNAAVVLMRRAAELGSSGSPLRVALAAAAQAGQAINDTGEGNTGLWRLVGRILQPFFRLIGGKHRVWPPSRQSAPLIILGWCLLTSPLWFLMRGECTPTHRGGGLRQSEEAS